MLLHPTGFHQLLVDQFSKGPTFIRETVPVTLAPTLVLTVDRRKANAVGLGEVFFTFHTFPRDRDSQSDLISANSQGSGLQHGHPRSHNRQHLKQRGVSSNVHRW